LGPWDATQQQHHQGQQEGSDYSHTAIVKIEWKRI